MKKRAFTFVAMTLPLCVFAQDIITTHDGDEIQAKVVEITDTDVKYKKWTNPDGPSYTMKKNSIFMIKYQNGDKDLFKTEPATTQSVQQNNADAPVVVVMQPSADNAAVIAKYNSLTPTFIKAKIKNNEAKNWMGILGVAPHSVMNSADLLISIEQEKKSMNKYEREQEGVYTPGFYTNLFECRYMISLTNNTNQIIYIDKTQSFKIDAQGSSMCFYNSDVTTVNQGTTSGSSMNLGAVAGALGVGGVIGTLANGATVGSARQNSVSTTKTDDRIVAVPPHGKITLCKDDRLEVGQKKKNLSFSEGMESVKISELCYGEVKDYTSETAPASIKYYFTYYKGNDTKTSYTQNVEVFPRHVVGIGSDFHNAFSNTKDRIYENFIKRFVSEVSPTTIVVIGIEK